MTLRTPPTEPRSPSSSPAGRPMRPWLRRTLIGLAALVAITLAAVASGLFMADRKMQRKVVVEVAGVVLRDDAAARERGRYLYASRGCADCHGDDGGGRTFIDGGGLRVGGPSIAPGQRSVVATYSARDWDRSIRHGVAPSGRPLMIMPSEDYNRFTDDDLASLVAWLRTAPPVQQRDRVLELSVPVRLAYAVGVVRDAADKIDHALPPSRPVAEAVSAEHGAYVANMCIGCHGPALAGGKIPGAPPDWPPAADLRPGAAMARYADADSFMRMLATGKRADGSEVRVMPFSSLRAMSVTDQRALHLHLRALPAEGGRASAP